MNSLTYLSEVGYICISGPAGEAFSGQLDESGKGCRVNLTAAGMEILMGVKESPAVDV